MTLKRKFEPENIATIDDFDFELYFVTVILGLNSLHYGYWKEDKLQTLENVKEAQGEYTKTLLSLIPSSVKSVLDVGSGIGDNAKAMVKTGLRVSAISPDKNHGQYYLQEPLINFYNLRFENFNEIEKFDLVLMSESHNYFDTNQALEKTNKLLNQNGYLLVSGIFNMSQDKTLDDVYYTEEDYITAAKNNGLELVDRVDITHNVLPTLKILYEMYTKYFLPTKKMFNHYLTFSAKYKWKVLRWLFNKQFKQLGKWESYYGSRLNPDLFENNARYLRLLFKNISEPKAIKAL